MSKMMTMLAAAGAVCAACAGEGPSVTLTAKDATAKIELDGARVTSLVLGGEEVLWSPRVPGVPGGARWNHGGMPVCWPHFGATNAVNRFQHGFARNCRFTVVDTSSTPQRSRALLELRSNDETRRLFPHDFVLRIEATLSDTLHMSLKTVNVGTDAFTFNGGFHPYFRIGERDRVRVTGTDGLAFCDSRVKSELNATWRGDMRLLSSFDHVFAEKGPTTTHSIVDPVLGRTITGTSSGVPRLVVWNPGAEEPVAANPGPGELAEGDWRHIVCVEPAFLWRDAAVTLPPGGRHEITFEISVAATR